MAKGYGFTEDAAKRVAQATRAVEQTPPERRVKPGLPAALGLPIKVGKLDGSLAYNSSATLSVWTFDGTTWADSGENITVHARTLDSGESIDAGTVVIAASNGRVWLMIDVQCSGFNT